MQHGPDLLRGQPYRWIDRGSDVLAVAHTDFVFGQGYRLKYQRRGQRVQCISLDDRLGVHVILDVLPQFGVLPDVLLTDDEEIGRSTAATFDPPKDYNWVFSFDRRGLGAVVYDYKEMIGIARHYFGKVHDGLFSDISFLEHLQCGGLNIGTGYYNEHSMRCHADLRQTMAQVKRFVTMYQDLKDTWIPHLCAAEAEPVQEDSDAPDPDDVFSLRWILEQDHGSPRVSDLN